MTAAPTPARAPSRTLTLGGTTYPVFLPSIRDPRLHVAAVIITIHVLGQVGLHFRVSIPQILASIITCAIIEVALTFRSSRMRSCGRPVPCSPAAASRSSCASWGRHRTTRGTPTPGTSSRSSAGSRS